MSIVKPPMAWDFVTESDSISSNAGFPALLNVLLYVKTQLVQINPKQLRIPQIDGSHKNSRPGGG